MSYKKPEGVRGSKLTDREFSLQANRYYNWLAVMKCNKSSRWFYQYLRTFNTPNEYIRHVAEYREQAATNYYTLLEVHKFRDFAKTYYPDRLDVTVYNTVANLITRYIDAPSMKGYMPLMEFVTKSNQYIKENGYDK